MVQLKKYFAWFTYKFVAIFLASIMALYVFMLVTSSMIISRMSDEPDPVSYMQTLQGLDMPAQEKVIEVFSKFIDSGDPSTTVNLSVLLGHSVGKVCLQVQDNQQQFERIIHEDISVFNIYNQTLGDIWWIFYTDREPSQVFLPRNGRHLSHTGDLAKGCAMGNLLKISITHDAEYGDTYFYQIYGGEK